MGRELAVECKQAQGAGGAVLLASLSWAASMKHAASWRGLMVAAAVPVPQAKMKAMLEEAGFGSAEVLDWDNPINR